MGGGDNDFYTSTFDDYLNFHVNILIQGEPIRRGATLKFPMVTHIEIDVSHPNLNLNKNIAN